MLAAAGLKYADTGGRFLNYIRREAKAQAELKRLLAKQTPAALCAENETLVFQLFDVDALVSGKGMPHRKNDYHFFLVPRAVIRCRYGNGAQHEAYVNKEVLDGVVLLVGWHVEKLYCDIRVKLLETLKGGGECAIDRKVLVVDRNIADIAGGCAEGQIYTSVDMMKDLIAFLQE